MRNLLITDDEIRFKDPTPFGAECFAAGGFSVLGLLPLFPHGVLTMTRIFTSVALCGVALLLWRRGMPSAVHRHYRRDAERWLDVNQGKYLDGIGISLTDPARDDARLERLVLTTRFSDGSYYQSNYELNRNHLAAAGQLLRHLEALVDPKLGDAQLMRWLLHPAQEDARFSLHSPRLGQTSLRLPPDSRVWLASRALTTSALGLALHFSIFMPIGYEGGAPHWYYSVGLGASLLIYLALTAIALFRDGASFRISNEHLLVERRHGLLDTRHYSFQPNGLRILWPRQANHWEQPLFLSDGIETLVLRTSPAGRQEIEAHIAQLAPAASASYFSSRKSSNAIGIKAAVEAKLTQSGSSLELSDSQSAPKSWPSHPSPAINAARLDSKREDMPRSSRHFAELAEESQLRDNRHERLSSKSSPFAALKTS